MEQARTPSTSAFGYWELGQVNPELTVKPADNRAVAALEAPLIIYYYATDNKYFEFGTTVPEGAVIPMEMFDPGSPFRHSVATWVNPQAPEILIGDQVRVDWTPLDGSAPFQSQPVTVTSKDSFLQVAIEDSVIAGFEGKTVEVVFIHLPQAGGAIPSPSRFVYVAPALGSKPLLQVEGVVDGVLDTSAYPDGIEVSIGPIENMRSYNAMEIIWTVEPDHWVERQRRMTVYPQQTMGFLVDPVVYQSHVGKRVTVQYRIYLGARMSPNFYWNPGGSTELSFELS